MRRELNYMKYKKNMKESGWGLKAASEDGSAATIAKMRKCK